MKKFMKRYSMLKPAFESMIMFGMACAPGVALAATEYNTEIFIGTATQLQGDNGSGARTTFFSQRMVLPRLYAGTVSSLQTATLTDTNANWSLGQFGSQAYVEFDNGWTTDIANSTTPTNLVLAG